MFRTCAPSIERLTFTFADLYITTYRANQADRRPVFGRAILAYDGRGQWWVETLVCHDRRFGKPDFTVDTGTQLWREIVVAMESARREEIAAAINAALDQGMHMALFDEHLPLEQVRRGPPPHVSFNLRRAPAALGRAAERVATMVGLVLLLGSIVAGGSIATMEWPGPQAHAARLPQSTAAHAFAMLDGVAR